MFNTDSTQIANPPAGFAPAIDTDGEPMGFWDGPTLERRGYEVQTAWSPERGSSFFIDHERNEAFTASEVRDLINTLTELLHSQES